MTNKEKFEEVFGFEPDIENTCPAPGEVCEKLPFDCSECPFSGWWDKEYKECFKLKREYGGKG